jgi:hypothetical protein
VPTSGLPPRMTNLSIVNAGFQPPDGSQPFDE